MPSARPRGLPASRCRRVGEMPGRGTRGGCSVLSPPPALWPRGGGSGGPQPPEGVRAARPCGGRQPPLAAGPRSAPRAPVSASGRSRVSAPAPDRLPLPSQRGPCHTGWGGCPQWGGLAWGVGSGGERGRPWGGIVQSGDLLSRGASAQGGVSARWEAGRVRGRAVPDGGPRLR